MDGARESIMPNDIRLILSDLRTALDSMRDAELCLTNVSHWSIGEHIEHLGKVSTMIFCHVSSPTPLPSVAGGITLVGRVALALGWIPRGKGKAPAATVPARADPATVSRALVDLIHHLEATELSPALAIDDRKLHPVFGALTRRQWLRFMAVHQRHHLKIVRDIRRSAPH